MFLEERFNSYGIGCEVEKKKKEMKGGRERRETLFLEEFFGFLSSRFNRVFQELFNGELKKVGDP